jgi:hypothetical protein
MGTFCDGLLVLLQSPASWLPMQPCREPPVMMSLPLFSKGHCYAVCMFPDVFMSVFKCRSLCRVAYFVGLFLLVCVVHASVKGLIVIVFCV